MAILSVTFFLFFFFVSPLWEKLLEIVENYRTTGIVVFCKNSTISSYNVISNKIQPQGVTTFFILNYVKIMLQSLLC